MLDIRRFYLALVVFLRFVEPLKPLFKERQHWKQEKRNQAVERERQEREAKQQVHPKDSG